MEKITMKKKISRMFKHLGIFEKMIGDRFKSEAYMRASDIFKNYDEAVLMKLANEKRLTEVEGIGPAIAAKAYEIMETGRLKKLDYYQTKVPVDIDDMLQLKGVGPKTIYKLFIFLNVRKRADIPQHKGKIAQIKMMSDRIEKNILSQVMNIKADEQLKLDYEE
jgi:DNA polymerase (family 10)